MKETDVLLVVSALLLLSLIFYFATAKGERKRITLISDGAAVSVDVEVADNFTTRARGLMGRNSLGPNEGMLFVFDKPGIYPFWMVNTSIPLDAIHIAENGTVVDVISMEPCGLNVAKCQLYTPKAPAKYVLEVNMGFAARHGVAAGMTRMNSG